MNRNNRSGKPGTSLAFTESSAGKSRRWGDKIFLVLTYPYYSLTLSKQGEKYPFCAPSRSHPLKAGAIDHKHGIPYLGSGSWSVAVRQIDPKEVKKRPWIAASGSFNHLYVVDTSETGYTAVAKDITGREIDRSERLWRRGKKLVAGGQPSCLVERLALERKLCSRMHEL